MTNKVEKEGDRGWVAGLVLVGLAALSLILGLASPMPPSGGALHARNAGPAERHATAATQPPVSP